MPSDSLQRDDDKFVEASLDPCTAQEQIDLHSKTRRTFYWLSMLQAILFVATGCMSAVEEMTSNGPVSYLQPLGAAFACVFCMAMYTHTDMRIKLLKVALAGQKQMA